MLLHKMIKQWISITLCSTILFPLMLQPVYGEDTNAQGVEGVLLSSQEGLLYSRFLEETAFIPYEGEALKFDAREAYLSEFSDGKEVEAAGVKAIQVAYKDSALFEF
ncbi:MAG: hypothetical protein JW708_11020, partial [Vallitaleaceae bacterium]|nr:hypothetical protein [Vallitaleaceae bacterium]